MSVINCEIREIFVHDDVQIAIAKNETDLVVLKKIDGGDWCYIISIRNHIWTEMNEDDKRRFSVYIMKNVIPQVGIKSMGQGNENQVVIEKHDRETDALFLFGETSIDPFGKFRKEPLAEINGSAYIYYQSMPFDIEAAVIEHEEDDYYFLKI
jgi:hypothetical protein